MLSLEERVDDLEWDGREVEEWKDRLAGLAATVEALARQVPGEEGMKRLVNEALLDKTESFRERLADLESIVHDAGGAALGARVAALETAERGADRSTQARVRRLERLVAGQVERLDGFVRDLAKVTQALEDLGRFLEEKLP